MEEPLLEVCVVSVVVVWVVVVLCEGDVADGLDWSVVDGVDGCCVLLGVDCAISQTLDSSRIDVIR